MKILVVHDRYQQAGGENAAVDAQVELLRQQGNEVILYQRDNQEIEEYSFFQKFRFFFSTFYSFRTVREIRQLVRRERPDIAHVHNVFPLISPSVYRILKIEKIPIIQTIHNFRFLCPNGLFFTRGQICEACKMGHYGNAIRWKCYRGNFLLSLLYAVTICLHRKIGTFDFPSAFIIVNPYTRQKLLETQFTDGDKIHYIPNFVQPQEKFYEVSHQAGIVYLGRLSAEKGVDDLLTCQNLLPDLKFTIAGVGPDEERLREIAKAGTGHVEFIGYVSGEKKNELIQQALAFVIPSKWYEQMPIVFLEVLASGKPLIVPDMGGWNSLVIDGENGFLYKPGDVSDLAEKIKLLLNNPGLVEKMGDSARIIYHKNYSPEVHYSKLIAIYQETISSSSKSRMTI
jgi:glycosyltransferase involved in cell wall biosynthesis